MSRPLFYVRIAFSALCGLSATLLLALWLHSYWWHDLIAIRVSPNVSIGGFSVGGHLVCGIQQPDSELGPFILQRLSIKDHPWLLGEVEEMRTTFGFMAGAFPRGWLVEMPHPFAIITLSVLATMPWLRDIRLRLLPWLFQLRWQFGLRTLLIATTAVCLGLGLVIYLTKSPATPPLDVGDFGTRSPSR